MREAEIKMDEMVSIVIPAYNRAAKIADAVRSIQQQTYKNWEIIVADDGSSDNTLKVIEDMAKEDKRIRSVRHERNKGAQTARNLGIRAARGPWIAFLDSDDQWLPESLEMRLRLAQQEDVAVVHSLAYIVHKDKPMEIYHLPAWRGQIYKNVLSHEGPMFQSLLVRKEALEKIGYLDESVVAYQEWDTAIRLAKFYPFGFVAKPTFIYDYTSQDAISRNSIRSAKGYEYILKKHFGDIVRYAGLAAVAYHYNVIARWYYEGGDARQAQRHSRLSLFFQLINPVIYLRKLKSFIRKP